MHYIDLWDRNRSLGRADVPAILSAPTSDFKYELKRVVRTGGNGVVFEAYRLRKQGGLDRRCAIKLLRRQDPARIDRFSNEARVLRELGTHERIAPYYDDGTVEIRVGQAYQVPWIAMELGGANLRDHVGKNGPLSSDTVIKVGVHLAEALAHLHGKGFIHRDIKPANLVWEDEHLGGALLIDLGIAKRQTEDVSARPLDNFTRQGEFVGPVFFSSPELIAYAEDQTHRVDHRSDIFQLGKVLWYLATGKISAGIPSKRDCPLGGRLHAFVLETLADSPDDRPSSAGVIIEHLKNINGTG